ncbi:hypothetical protein AAFF_G00065460 [Aldrovandia affinis]|uniref:Protein prune homolog 2 n=1 Tax=Aldrovandia affinis TaxID=143900 RepID=A0AAD7T426_9TELE|nr:hypothetical protein AAFF_G00065460 [Aldrovandia affinis]
MEDFLLRTKSTLVSGSQCSRVHGVLGGEEADITCVASTLGYAYFLSQGELGDTMCVPVLYQRRSEARVPEETRSFLQGLGVPESALLWWDDLELHQLHTAGKLSLTLLHTDLLSVEDGALASCVVRVINCSERQGVGEGASSTAMVAREILQKAPERLTAPLAGLLRGALLLESGKAPYQDGRPSPDHEELLRALEHCCPSHDDVIQNAPAPEAGLQGASLDQMLLKELKELSDGDIKVSVSMVSLDLEAYSTCPTLIGDLKSFCDRHGYEGLVILSSSLQEPYHQCQQVAVFSGNKDILNQICCELEEGRSWSLGLEPLSCLMEAVQLYRQRGSSVYAEQIVTLLQEFLDRRQRLFLPNSRTSSTEGVAGSAPLSQGSSGITDMYSSDAEPANAAESVPEPGGAPQALGEPGAELVSPDSGLVTVRSSRSSKESSVFLSDDSPVAETTGFLHNPALSFPSLCAAAAAAATAGRPAPRERGLSARNKSDNLDLFGFDPLRSGCTSPAAGGADEHTRSSGEHASSSLSEFGELSLVDFYSESSGRQSGSEGSFLMEGGFPSPLLDPLLCDSTDGRLPATPVNSLVEGDGGGGRVHPKFFPDVADKINELGNKESVSSSEPWDDFTSDTKGSTSDDANTWSLMEAAYVGEESPDVYLDEQEGANDVGQAGGEGIGRDDDSFLLVSMDSGAMSSSTRDTLLWASSVPKGALDMSDPAITHLGQVQHGMLPTAGESQEGAGVHLHDSVLESSEPSSNYTKSWGYFDGKKDHDVTEMSDVMRLLSPFNVCETQKQPEDRESVNVLPPSPNQEHRPATPCDAERWDNQEEGKGFPLAKDGVSSHQNTDCHPQSGVERFAVGESTFQTQQAELGGENAQPLEDEEGSLWRLDEHQVPVKQESRGKEWRPAECAPTQLDAGSEREVGDFSDVRIILSDIPDTHVPTFPEHGTSAVEDLPAENGKAYHFKEPSLSPDSAHMWNPFVQMTQQAETYDNWNPNLPVSDVWNPGTLGDLQLTPPEEEDTPLHPPGMGEHVPLKALASLSQKTPLTPETSKEDSSHSQDGSPESDFWSYSAQRGFLQAAGPYPDSLGLWNTTIQDDSQSTLSTPDFSERREGMGMWNTTIQETSPEGVARPSSDTPGQTQEDRGSEVRLTEPVEPGGVQEAWQLDKLPPLIHDYGHAQESNITAQIQHLPGHLLLQPSTWNATPTCGSMVKSVSEYDNVDAGTLWYPNSPELEGCQEAAIFTGTRVMAPLAEERHPLAVDENGEESQALADALPERPDSADDSSCNSPFVLLGVTPPPGGTAFPLSQREDTPPSGDELTCTLGKRLSSAPSRLDRPYDWDVLVKLGSTKLPTKQAECEGPSPQQRAHTSHPSRFSPDMELPCVVGPMPDVATLPMASASPGSRETDSLDGSKASPDPLQRDSREDVRSNSDGDSSGLEMDYIMVSDTASPHQRSTDASSAVARELSGHFRAKEEIYVRSQISLEDSEEEEGGTPGGPQSWVPPAGDDPGDTPSPGDSSGMTDTPESDSGRSVREVGSPFACDLTGEADGFFLHQAAPPAGHSLMMPVHAEPMGGQLLTRRGESKQPIGETAERASEEPNAAEDSGLRGLGGEECRTNIVFTVTEPDDTQGMSPRSPLDDVGMDVPYEEDTTSPDGAENRPVPPSSLDLQGGHPQRKKLSAPEINLSLDQSEGSILSDDALDTPDDLDIDVDELDTPDEADSLEYTGHNNELEWEESQAANQEVPREAREAIPEYTAEEERQDARLWRTVIIGEQEHRIDMKSIEPFQKVISHGGYYGDLNAIIVFAACFLPDSSRDDYHYVMENLFLYVISTLELMVAEDYMIVYLNGATPRRRMPGLGWLKKCYYMIDRRLRKNLKSFIIVHPSWFIRTILAVTRPFISSKFSSKIKYVSSLSELRQIIPMEYVHIPETIVKYEDERGIMRFACMRLDEELKEATEAAKYTSFLNGGEAPQIDKTVNASGS